MLNTLVVRLDRRSFVLSLASATVAACRKEQGDGLARPSRTARIRVGAIELNTVQIGPSDGAVRLVVHGGPGLDHHYLRPAFDELADQRTRVVYVDLRGHGASEAPPDAEGYTIAAAAGDLAQLARRLSERAPIDVIGHDFGGAIALELAATHPECVRRLVLVSPVRDGRQLRAMPERARVALGESGVRELASLSTPQGTLRDPRDLVKLFRTLAPMWWAQSPSPQAIEALARGVRYRAVADEHFLVQLRAWDGRTIAERVRAESLVISGELDRTFTPTESRSVADALAHGRFASVAQAGHLPFVEQPRAFFGIVRGFLR
ncbi:MAG: alpha/beta hydrolase [Myxococcales bacterium]|nr:alpha/beta hydrolase [Myxococcales bacterium]